MAVRTAGETWASPAVNSGSSSGSGGPSIRFLAGAGRERQRGNQDQGAHCMGREHGILLGVDMARLPLTAASSPNTPKRPFHAQPGPCCLTTRRPLPRAIPPSRSCLPASATGGGMRSTSCSPRVPGTAGAGPPPATGVAGRRHPQHHGPGTRGLPEAGGPPAGRMVDRGALPRGGGASHPPDPDQLRPGPAGTETGRWGRRIPLGEEQLERGPDGFGIEWHDQVLEMDEASAGSRSTASARAGSSSAGFLEG